MITKGRFGALFLGRPFNADSIPLMLTLLTPRSRASVNKVNNLVVQVGANGELGPNRADLLTLLHARAETVSISFLSLIQSRTHPRARCNKVNMGCGGVLAA